jgi:two-component system LytT family sensor kinase
VEIKDTLVEMTVGTKNLWTKNWLRIAVHISIWIVIILSNYIFDYDDERVNPYGGVNVVTNIFRAGIFYFNAELLVPVLIYKKKYLGYFLALIALFLVMMLFHGLIFQLLVDRRFVLLKAAAHNILPFIITITASTAYKTITDKAKADAIASERLQENLKTEVSFLRSQISPHFIFNVLNNIVALVRLKSAELEPTVMRLSTLMQYMLYETDKKVSLHDEIQYLKDYIELQEQRFGEYIRITKHFETPAANFIIEPMLLISFVENAFKHSEGLVEAPTIDIQLRCEQNKLYFSVRNNYNEEASGSKDKTSGIGLANVRRRLSLLYPDKHNLVINKSEGYFNVSLELIIEYA